MLVFEKQKIRRASCCWLSYFTSHWGQWYFQPWRETWMCRRDCGQSVGHGFSETNQQKNKITQNPSKMVQENVEHSLEVRVEVWGLGFSVTRLPVYVVKVRLVSEAPWNDRQFTLTVGRPGRPEHEGDPTNEEEWGKWQVTRRESKVKEGTNAEHNWRHSWFLSYCSVSNQKGVPKNDMNLVGIMIYFSLFGYQLAPSSGLA